MLRAVSGSGRVVLQGRVVGDLAFRAGGCTFRYTDNLLDADHDAHLKNWTLWYPDGRTPRLSPAYDLVCTTIYKNLPNRLTFAVGEHIRPDAVERVDLMAVANVADFPRSVAIEVIDAAVSALMEAWGEIRKEPLFPTLIAHIDERLARHPLLSG